MVIYLIILFALVCLGMLMVIPAIRILENRPTALLWIVVLVFIGASLFDNAFLPVINFGPISVNPIDVVGPMLLCLTFPFVYFSLRGGFERKDLGMLLFLIWSMILMLNYVLGLHEFGLQVATNEFRGYFYIICVGCYVASLDVKKVWPAIEKMCLFAAFCLSIIALVRFSDGDFTRGGRPIGSAHTLLMLQALLIAVFMHNRGDLRSSLKPFLVAIIPLLIVLQHRSVWGVMLFSFVLVFMLLPSARAMLVKWGVIGTVAFGGLCGVVFGASIFEQFAYSYKESTSIETSDGSNTFVWRMQGWRSLLTGEQMDSVQDVLIGNSFGSGWDRTVLTSDGVMGVRTETPHNFYVQTLLRGGVIGLVAFLSLYIILLRRLFHYAKKDTTTRPILLCLVVLIASQLVYYIPYGSDFIQAMFLGSGVAWLRYSETTNSEI